MASFLPFVLTFLIQFCFAIGEIKSHRILSLPDSAPVEFTQYSGYITVGETHMFYYFVEAEVDPTSKPLVLWFQGGPGCSSVGNGAFREHGPLRIHGTALAANNYSWNKEANMLYLDSPAGVGFSYSTNKSYFMDDQTTASDNFLFLKKWLAEYSEYKNNHFYISGESYAGHFAPQLAHLIINSKVKINLKGVVIGNPLLHFNNDYSVQPEFLRTHDLISDSTFHLFSTICSYTQLQRESLRGAHSPNCARVSHQAYTEGTPYVDFRSVLLNGCPSPYKPPSHPLYQSLQTYSEDIDICTIDKIIVYLNRADVLRAMHARIVDVNEWVHCRAVSYNYSNYELPTITILGSLVRSGIRVLAYSGDQDAMIPFTATRALIEKLAKELGLNTPVKYRAWFDGKTVAGRAHAYGDDLTFATVRGAGHEVAFNQPSEALVLFRSFVRGEPLPDIEK